MCDKPIVQTYRPFCSKACADVDLGRWFSGRYVVPGGPASHKGDEEAED
ncbi:MAG TPA: DNA gyrase inhibitor YacG [Methyloceanibacter sp.]|nr:DNA gyrase inhibitor YacG [Methyloceanibacter sp.]